MLKIHWEKMRDSKKILQTDPDTDMLLDPGTQFEHPGDFSCIVSFYSFGPTGVTKYTIN